MQLISKIQLKLNLFLVIMRENTVLEESGMSHKVYLPQVEMVYESLKKTDQLIANFFFYDANQFSDLSAKVVADYLHISLPSLTRFAQKCGYKGYRQLVYDVENSRVDHQEMNIGTSSVLTDYNTLLRKASALTQDGSLNRICQDLTRYKAIYIYGIGHSGLVAKEIELRFNRIGIPCRAITDREQILVNYAIVDEASLVIGLSISGKSDVVLMGLKSAAQQGGRTYILTTQKADYEGVDEMILVPSVLNLNYGNRISPQFPLLVIVDLIYDDIMRHNGELKDRIFKETLTVLDKPESAGR